MIRVSSALRICIVLARVMVVVLVMVGVVVFVSFWPARNEIAQSGSTSEVQKLFGGISAGVVVALWLVVSVSVVSSWLGLCVVGLRCSLSVSEFGVVGEWMVWLWSFLHTSGFGALVLVK